MKAYKYTNADLTTANGFQFEVGVPATPRHINPDAGLCSEYWLHAYPSLALAAFMAPMHIDYNDPRLFEAEACGYTKFNGGKMGCTELTLVREIAIPTVPIEARVEFAIRAVKLVIGGRCPEWSVWAEAWLSGDNHAAHAAYAARAAARAARAAYAADAAHAAYAADAAHAAYAAAYAADAAADAVGADADFEQRLMEIADAVLAKYV